METSTQQTLDTDAVAHLQQWIGRCEALHDDISAAPLRGLSATLDRDDPAPQRGTVVPPLGHWLYFLPQALQSQIGPDGHPKRGGFLPPVPLPRRMWAGSQLEFRSPVRVGDAVERSSVIADVTTKNGRTGRLVFVRVRHELRCNGAADAAIVEFHDIVYREAKKPSDVEPPPVAAAQGEWQRQIVPDDVLLFRYSALTFNGHRIHYDRRYATQVEGYPGLIVHGPLIATLLMDLVRRHAPQAQVTGFRFKAVRPTFDLHPFKVNGRRDGNEVKLWAQDHEGWLTMDATAVLKNPP